MYKRRNINNSMVAHTKEETKYLEEVVKQLTNPNNVLEEQVEVGSKAQDGFLVEAIDTNDKETSRKLIKEGVTKNLDKHKILERKKEESYDAYVYRWSEEAKNGINANMINSLEKEIESQVFILEGKLDAIEHTKTMLASYTKGVKKAWEVKRKLSSVSAKLDNIEEHIAPSDRDVIHQLKVQPPQELIKEDVAIDQPSQWGDALGEAYSNAKLKASNKALQEELDDLKAKLNQQ
jgi:hypothetical protein